jgi:PAS domain-containing protein
LLGDVKLMALREESILARADAILNGMPLRQEVAPGIDPAICVDFLTARVRGEPSFAAAAVLEPDGRRRCTSAPAPEWSIDRRGAFFRAMAGGTLIVTGVAGDPGVLLFGKAMHTADGRLSGLAVLQLDITWLRDVIAQTELPQGARISVIDGTSRILARHPDPGHMAGQRRPESRIIQTVLASRGAGTLEERALTGEMRIVAHAPILTTVEGLAHHLLLSVPKQAVIGPAQLRGLGSFGVLLAVLVGVLLALVAGMDRMLMRPLARLVETSRRLDQGDLTARTGLPHGATEIGVLARQIDHLARVIERREGELREKAALLDSANDAIMVCDMGWRVSYWNRTSEQTYGWAAPEARGRCLRDLMIPDQGSFDLAASVLHRDGR